LMNWRRWAAAAKVESLSGMRISGVVVVGW
jgi:hypothetical protein